MKKKIFLIIGILSVILGTAGIFLPLLPTTPFLLLAAFSFEKSSDKFYTLLINNKYFGKYLSDYKEKKGMTLKNKLIAITVLTLGMAKGFLSMNNKFGKITLLIIFFSVTYHIIKINTLKKEI
ncbi:YbaN family protein [uncultured Cetobacterium sp.]|uniref:YbaN family protein n=1 Tax=uncultured Cetobacterium sp. TaxID=527638 RepID=UPI00260469D0|nr:YbaN family protein [uncultured Cetobacterium sp.]